MCPNGYYDQVTCLSCHYSCYSCRNLTQWNCTACSSVNKRTLDTTTNECACDSGFYESGGAQCQSCDNSCLTCVTNSTTCTSCHNVSGRFLAGSSCVCSSAGYIDIYFNGTCSSCHYSCTTCHGILSTNCDTCASNRTLQSGECLCPTGYYDGSSVACQLCVATCVNCTSSLSTSCTACNSLYLRSLTSTPSGSCQCNNGYYDSGALICQLCSSKCLTCTGTSTNCSSCDTVNHFRTLSTSFSCDCLNGYFDSGSLSVCQTCTSSCLTCISIPTQCTSCNSERTLVSTSCDCNNGTFQNSSGLC